MFLPCSYLGGSVEFTEECEQHIAERHPDLAPQHRSLIELTLADPDIVRVSSRNPRARLLSRWYDELLSGKHVVVVVSERHVVTAYIARTLSGGEIEWKRN